MNSALLIRIRTLEERDKLLDEVGLLLKSLYETDKPETSEGIGKGLDVAADFADLWKKSIHITLTTKIRQWVATIVASDLPGEFSSTEKYLKTLKEELEKMKAVILRVAFEPTELTIEKFSSFVRQNSEENLLVDFEYDPGVLGGVQITFEGEYRDFSLRRMFEEEYAKKEKDLLRIIYSK